MEKVTEDIVNIGVNDREITLFEGQYELEKGMAYNSYIILDEQVVVMDTVDPRATAEWMRHWGQEKLTILSYNIWSLITAAASCS